MMAAGRAAPCGALRPPDGLLLRVLIGAGPGAAQVAFDWELDTSIVHTAALYLDAYLQHGPPVEQLSK